MKTVKQRLRLNMKSVRQFVSELNQSNTTDLWYVITDEEDMRINARSMLGMLYVTDSWDVIYLINETHPGEYLKFMEKYFYR